MAPRCGARVLDLLHPPRSESSAGMRGRAGTFTGPVGAGSLGTGALWVEQLAGPAVVTWQCPRDWEEAAGGGGNADPTSAWFAGRAGEMETVRPCNRLGPQEDS